MIFARIILGHLYTHPELVDEVDAIIPMPAYLEPHQARKGMITLGTSSNGRSSKTVRISPSC